MESNTAYAALVADMEQRTSNFDVQLQYLSKSHKEQVDELSRQLRVAELKLYDSSRYAGVDNTKPRTADPITQRPNRMMA